jgi:hypothetical protein
MSKIDLQINLQIDLQIFHGRFFHPCSHIGTVIGANENAPGRWPGAPEQQQ